jgi:hypothetical protein
MRISLTKTDAINGTLATIQGKATVNLFDADRLARLAKTAEQQMEDMDIPKKYRAGAQYDFCDAGPTATAYKYKQSATLVTIERGASGWFLIEAQRVTVFPKV